MTLLTDFSGCLLPFSQEVTVKRPLPAVMDHGRLKETPDAKVFQIEASVQPASSEDQQELPEGQRNKGTIKIYTDFLLQTVKTSEFRTSDIVVVEGIEYGVDKVDDWRATANYVKALCTRMPT